MEFYEYRYNPEIDFLIERSLVDDLNMTARLSVRHSIASLTRAFHINTIVGRLLSPWVWSLSRTGPKRFLEKHPITPQMKAAYGLFKDEVLKAVACLPDKMGFDVNQGRLVSVLEPVYQTFPEIDDLECVDPILHIRKAWNIYNAVWGKSPSHTRDCQNFLEIVRDEFYTYGEIAPTLGSAGTDPITENIRQELDDEVKFYYDQFFT